MSHATKRAMNALRRVEGATVEERIISTVKQFAGEDPHTAARREWIVRAPDTDRVVLVTQDDDTGARCHLWLFTQEIDMARGSYAACAKTIRSATDWIGGVE
jgi:hypothetical protein